MSVVKCPKCGTFRMERMPEAALVLHWRCPGCDAVIEPRPGDCCVYCSYGSVKCPRAQKAAIIDLSSLGDGAPARKD